MKNLQQILASYGNYHQNSLNKITHIIGVPVIVFAVMILVNWVYLLWPLIVISCGYYLYLSRKLGGILLLVFILLGLLVQSLVPTANLQGWIIFLVLFIGSWIIQFIGHGFEGKKPAFFDNLLQMLSAPLFVVHEILSLFQSKNT